MNIPAHTRDTKTPAFEEDVRRFMRGGETRADRPSGCRIIGAFHPSVGVAAAPCFISTIACEHPRIRSSGCRPAKGHRPFLSRWQKPLSRRKMKSACSRGEFKQPRELGDLDSPHAKQRQKELDIGGGNPFSVGSNQRPFATAAATVDPPTYPLAMHSIQSLGRPL